MVTVNPYSHPDMPETVVYDVILQGAEYMEDSTMMLNEQEATTVLAGLASALGYSCTSLADNSES